MGWSSLLHGQRNSKGAAILFQKNFDFELCSVSTDFAGRWILLNLRVQEERLCIMKLYGPNIDDPTLFDTIINKLQDTEGKIIVVGDFSIALNSAMDRKGNSTSNTHPYALSKINNLIDFLVLVDIWRFKNPNLIRYTWRRQNQASRIDYFQISFSPISKVTGVSMGDRLQSDHNSIGLNLSFIQNVHGRGYWKFNQSLLQDAEFVEKTKKFIDDFFANNIDSSNPIIVWEALNCSFRGYAIACSSWKKKK